MDEIEHQVRAYLPSTYLTDEGPVFAEPWQAEAFAITVHLLRRGVFSWAEWTEAIGKEIADAGPDDHGGRYYEFWLAALEKLATGKALTTPKEMQDVKSAWRHAYATTPHGDPVKLPET